MFDEHCENCKKKFFIIRNIIELHYSKIIFNIIILLFDKKYFSLQNINNLKL